MIMNQKSGTDAHGLTLIELMIALSLIAVGFVLLLGSFPAIHGTIAATRDTERALYQAMTVLEEIKALPSSELETYIPPALNELGTDEVITVTVLDNAGNEVALPTDFSTVPAGVPDPVEVRIHVQWSDLSGRPRTTTVATKKLLLS